MYVAESVIVSSKYTSRSAEIRIFSIKGKTSKTKVAEGTNLLKVIQKSGFDISAPCKGNGTCGKCKVIVEGANEEIKGREKKLLGSKLIENGYRLACYHEVKGELDIYLDKKETEAQIAVNTIEKKVELDPIVKKIIRFIS